VHTAGFDGLKKNFSQKPESFEIKEAFKFILDNQTDMEDLDIGFAQNVKQNTDIQE
jgi:hypothetical protein